MLADEDGHRTMHVLVTMPPLIPDGRSDEAVAFDGALRQFFRTTDNFGKFSRRHGSWIGYVSTTSVYGDHGGGWVDEDARILAPKGSSGERYYNVERSYLSLADEANFCVRIFRCAGIYGPHASALHVAWKSMMCGDDEGEKHESMPLPIDATGKKFTSRIHVDDVAQCILASMLKWRREKLLLDSGMNESLGVIKAMSGGRIYNIADDEPAPRDEVVSYAQKVLKREKWEGLSLEKAARNYAKVRRSQFPRHGSSAAITSKRPRRRAVGSKRVSNDRISAELLGNNADKNDEIKNHWEKEVRLLYPTYREGLEQVLEKSALDFLEMATEGIMHQNNSTENDALRG
mmetsp:Transcript_10795/g.23707  ORF Transcript_10795/g.23707 Transcript_10795/m.23707 type:complete len:346 (-) Transcript_10795:36-1073(-)